jgi:hypothetical protein
LQNNTAQQTSNNVETKIIFVDHLTAGLIEQDVFVEKEKDQDWFTAFYRLKGKIIWTQNCTKRQNHKNMIRLMQGMRALLRKVQKPE